MDIKNERTANLALAQTVAMVKPSWQNPAPVRAIVKRTFLGYIKALFNFS